MIFLLILIILFFIALIIRNIYYNKLYQQISEKKTYYTKQITNIYVKKDFMTNFELSFYDKLKPLEANYKVIPQVPLSSLVDKVNRYKTPLELFRTIDFVIFDNNFHPLLLIELNDKTHHEKNRIKRDNKVKNIVSSAGLKIIFFYSEYSNEKEYVINRIMENIKN